MTHECWQIRVKGLSATRPDRLAQTINDFLDELGAKDCALRRIHYAATANDFDGGAWEYSALIEYALPRPQEAAP